MVKGRYNKEAMSSSQLPVVVLPSRHQLLLPLLLVVVVISVEWRVAPYDYRWGCSAFSIRTTTVTKNTDNLRHTKRSSSWLLSELQRCVKPSDLLERVGSQVTTTKGFDPDGSIASLVLVRLSKQLIAQDNWNHSHNTTTTNTVTTASNQTKDKNQNPLLNSSEMAILQDLTCHVFHCRDYSNVDALVEHTKACAVLARLMHTDSLQEPLQIFWKDTIPSTQLLNQMEDYHLSGLQWSFDSFRCVDTANTESQLPHFLESAYNNLQLPFRIYPGLLSKDPILSVDQFVSEVDFRVDEICTSAAGKTDHRHMVSERRQTAWQGDARVGPFQYSGKSMVRQDWSPTVTQVRDVLTQAPIQQYYDGCLLNLYPDGQSGMRYHIDPDQGALWDYNTAVVSVGATRRFSFRQMNEQQHKPAHNFVVMHGDVTHMFNDCQQRFQHAVRNADDRQEQASRVSLVFKRSWMKHDS